MFSFIITELLQAKHIDFRNQSWSMLVDSNVLFTMAESTHNKCLWAKPMCPENLVVNLMELL